MINPDDIKAVYCDGGVILKNPSKIGGTWAYCYVNEHGERIVEKSGVRLLAENLSPEQNARAIALGYKLTVRHDPGDLNTVTNNQTEYIAAVQAITDLPPGWSGPLYSDSQITLGRLFQGWANNGLPLAWVRIANERKRKLGKVIPMLLQGHPTDRDLELGWGAKRGLPVSVHNRWCDEECGRLHAAIVRDVLGEHTRRGSHIKAIK